MEAYHDHEWGRPVHDDRSLFEHLALDSFQSGLSWMVILRKREAFRRAFHGFDPERIARFTARDVRRLLADPGIVRNRAKIEATIANAWAVLRLQQEYGSFDRYIWAFTDGRVLRGKPARRWSHIPSTSPESDAMAKDMRARGFRFVGSTVCYAFMQAVGIVDDHLVGCFRYVPRR
jgi:DNA-3-methyladenine glycosylase I